MRHSPRTELPTNRRKQPLGQFARRGARPHAWDTERLQPQCAYLKKDLELLHYFYRAGYCSGNAPHLYSGYPRFESRHGYVLSWFSSDLPRILRYYLDYATIISFQILSNSHVGAWVATSCSSEKARRFGGTHCLDQRVWQLRLSSASAGFLFGLLFDPKMDAISSSETSASSNYTASQAWRPSSSCYHSTILTASEHEQEKVLLRRISWFSYVHTYRLWS
jgi:hypothetical protein